ncbi:cyclophilin-like fold protein [Desulforhopalus singaporensis]|uniref:Cyclophilin-like domain-containing protein n=1 Tax=Desulforhopalus singaporensis TaxID=91360 RepID=A0A1H0PR33_9BACT|nr:cyclophilin-like fold protein [Desulforhopalus singaporensis]SDP07611.1 hypothetical protein SAMN05660330_01732 [Desulforhopalus singaporensis]
MIVEKRRCAQGVFPVLAIGIMFIVLASGVINEGKASADEIYDLALSTMHIRITSQEHTATFGLYDTVAAREFYDQLPLELELSNFGDAQWMFFPPEKLNVTPHEAYHDGEKGELSYYKPWGDVFMLYKEFHAGDEMHRLGVGLAGTDGIAHMSGTVLIEKNQPEKNISGIQKHMHIQVIANNKTTIFKLNDSQASREFYAQLPLNIEVENYGDKEKIFYPPQKLGTADTPKADARAGTLAYYAPWGNVVMFYGKFGSAGGLFELGKAVSGDEYLRDMSGIIKVEKIDQ